MVAYKKKNKKLVIFGTGLIAEEMYHYFSLDSDYDVIGFTVNKNYLKKKFFLKKKVYSFENITKYLNSKKFYLFVAIGYTDLNQLRQKIVNEAKKKKFKIASYISSKSSFYSSEKNFENNVILEHSTIQPTAKIGKNVFIWSNNLIGHHAIIKDNCYISGHCSVAGSSVIEKNCFVGVNSTVVHNVKVGKNCLIGANSLVAESISNQSISIPNKTKILKVKNLDIIKKMIK